MSWLFSRVLVEEYLGENSSDGEQSVPSSGHHTQQAYLSPDKMTDFSRLSRFGMTFKPLMEPRGEELLMLYLAAFHAKTLAQQGKAQESKAQGLECGEKWQGLLAKYDHATHSWKTAQCSLLEDLEQSLQTWPRWGSMRNGVCYLQPMLAQITSESVYGLLPNNETFFHTPNTTGLDGGSNSRKAIKKRTANTPSGNYNRAGASANSGNGLATAVKLWPTPRAAHSGSRPNGKGGKIMEEEVLIAAGLRERGVKMWPTPTVQDNKNNGAPSQMERNIKPLNAEVGGKLNPTWVEWLMGWPLGWTDLKPLATDRCRNVQQKHGGF